MKILTVALIVIDLAIFGHIVAQIIGWVFLWG